MPAPGGLTPGRCPGVKSEHALVDGPGQPELGHVPGLPRCACLRGTSALPSTTPRHLTRLSLVARPLGAGMWYGVPRAAGPGVNHPDELTATQVAAVKRPFTARLTSRNPRPAVSHAPAAGLTPYGRAGLVNPAAVPCGSGDAGKPRRGAPGAQRTVVLLRLRLPTC